MFNCQHGADECAGNKIHSCAVQKLPPAHASAFVNCSMANFRSPGGDPGCATELGFNFTERIQPCVDSWEGDALLATNGIKTHDLRPKLYYVPWIQFDRKFSTEDLDLAQRDLLGLLCNKLNAKGLAPEAECKDKLNKDKPAM